MKDMKEKVAELEALITDKPDPNWETLALSMAGGMNPQMRLLSFNYKASVSKRENIN